MHHYVGFSQIGSHLLYTDKKASYKVCLYSIVLSVTVYTVWYVCSFFGDQIFMDFVSFLSMVINEVLNT